jgi:hypothetical protein
MTTMRMKRSKHLNFGVPASHEDGSLEVIFTRVGPFIYRKPISSQILGDFLPAELSH